MKMTFQQFMKVVDRHIARVMGGLTSDDLPDYTYRDDYDDGRDPNDTAARAIRHAKTF